MPRRTIRKRAKKPKSNRNINIVYRVLRKENNLLILHAEDLGAIIPNTVAVSIYDGSKEEIIILSSNLNVSGAILIRQFDHKQE